MWVDRADISVDFGRVVKDESLQIQTSYSHKKFKMVLLKKKKTVLYVQRVAVNGHKVFYIH